MTSTQSSIVAELDLLTVSGRAMIERIGILESDRHATALFTPAWFAITKRIHDVEREHETIAQRRWDILRADVNLSESTFAILPDLPPALPSGLDAAPVDPAPAAVERPNVPFVATHIDISDQPAPPAHDNCPEWARRRQWSYTVTRKTADGSEVIKTGTMISDRDYNTVTFYLAFAWNVRTWHHGGHKQDDSGLITAVRMWGRQNKAIITVIAELMPEKPAAVDTMLLHHHPTIEENRTPAEALAEIERLTEQHCRFIDKWHAGQTWNGDHAADHERTIRRIQILWPYGGRVANLLRVVFPELDGAALVQALKDRKEWDEAYWLEQSLPPAAVDTGRAHGPALEWENVFTDLQAEHGSAHDGNNWTRERVRIRRAMRHAADSSIPAQTARDILRAITNEPAILASAELLIANRPSLQHGLQHDGPSLQHQPTPAASIAAATQVTGRELTTRDACALFAAPAPRYWKHWRGAVTTIGKPEDLARKGWEEITEEQYHAIMQSMIDAGRYWLKSASGKGPRADITR